MKKCIVLSAVFVLCSLCLSYVSAAEYDKQTLQNDFDELRERVRANPKDIPSINSLGIIYAHEKQYSTAIELWSYALKIDPSYIHLYNNLGAAYREIGKIEQSRLIYRAGLAVKPSYWIYYNLGLLEKSDNNILEAVNCFKKSLALQPGFEAARKQLKELGYELEGVKMICKTPVSIGSFRPPSELDSIDLEQLVKQEQKKASKPSKPFKPLSYSDCDSIVKALKAEPKDKVIAITFDDGPHRTITPALLKLLKEEGVKATFFVVGSRAEMYPDILAKIAAEGHDIGNHTWQHKSLTKSSYENAEKSLEKTNEVIGTITQKNCNLVRPPYGSTNRRVKELIHSHGWHEVMWDTDSRDWQNKDPRHILARVMRSIRPKNIVLFHDIHEGALKMLPTMIRAFKANGYRFITVNELIALSST